MQRLLLIAVGGALGALLRYFVAVFAAQRYGTRFPAGTLIINLTACFLIGALLEYLNRHTGISDSWRYFIPIGFIGAYSTFSTFEYELWASLTRGDYWITLTYVSASLIGGLIFVGLGSAVARTLP